ncbi:MAG: hypothetical protein ACXVH3_25710 [Solirubrobacteraceae bacterium]
MALPVEAALFDWLLPDGTAAGLSVEGAAAFDCADGAALPDGAAWPDCGAEHPQLDPDWPTEDGAAVFEPASCCAAESMPPSWPVLAACSSCWSGEGWHPQPPP